MSLRVADLDNDGGEELVCLALDSTYSPGGASSHIVLDAADLTLRSRINQTGLGTSLAVGNVDADVGGFVTR